VIEAYDLIEFWIYLYKEIIRRLDTYARTDSMGLCKVSWIFRYSQSG
jgi:hypothetical protein